MDITLIIAQYKKEQQDMLPSCKNSLMKQTKKEIAERKNERTKFLTDYNPDTQMKICEDKDLCYFGQFPTLGAINRQYGSTTATVWLIPQITNLSEFCGCKNKITPNQIRECATIIAQNYFYLKVSELMLFFYLFKTGRYGKFYGNVDPMVITTALRDFMRDRSDAIFHHESEIAARKREEEDRKRREYEEDCKRKGIEPYKHRVLTSLTSKPKKNEYTKEQIKTYAELLANNIKGYSKETLKGFVDWFTNKFKATPKEWLEKNK